MRIATLAAMTLLTASHARTASAADSCTILYKLDGTLQVTDTAMGKGDETIEGLKGSLVLEFKKRDGAVVDGKVKLLHFAMHQSFTLESVVDVTTTLHHYAPSCNGVEQPSWRRPSDPGFPKECRYDGNERALATGDLNREAGKIDWDRCNAAKDYWAKGKDEYTFADKSRGKGCLEDLHVVGNIHCKGRIGCKWGSLKSGDNPQFDVWTQPMIHGPDGSDDSISISEDLSKFRTPGGRKDGGYQAYNVPNDAPSRTWMSWSARRDDSSPYTTCP
jgi:hypothetical protein